MKKIIKGGTISLFLLTILFLAFVFFVPTRTPKITNSSGKSVADSVCKIEKVVLGDVKQYILVRGESKDNPLLLFLHGGPGYPQISFARKYQEKLEKDFLVINWDQRGSGKSYSFNIKADTMNRKQFISDTKELIDYLCKEYKKEKVYLVGHSWGTELGLYVVDTYPDSIVAFISIGQVVNETRGEAISYEFVLSMAEKKNDEKAIASLVSIGRPPYKDPVKGTTIQRKLLEKYGGVERKVNTLHDIIVGSIFTPEYTGLDGIKFVLGSKFTAETMWGKNPGLNFVAEIPKVKVPIIFCAGRYDYNTPSELTEDYYKQISAPYKELIWFDESAHFPHFEEPDKFYSIMKRIKDLKQ